MKYINKRTDFLKNINEAFDMSGNAGPFHNDINWGDSLLGRLINSTMRKAQIGANLVQIKQVCNRLKDSFESLLLNSKAESLTDESKKEYEEVMLFSYLYNLEQSVKNKNSLDEIINFNKIAIKESNSKENIKDKENLTKQLSEFDKFLESLKSSKGNDSNITLDKKKDQYTSYVKNFKSLLNIILLYRDMKKDRENAIIPHLNQQKSFSKGNLSNKERNTIADKKINTNIKSVINKEVPIKTSDNISEAKSFEIISIIKSISDTLMQLDNDLVNNISSFMKSNTEILLSPKYKDNIQKIYLIIINKFNPSKVNENIESIISNYEKVAEKIISLYQVSKNNALGDFEGISDKLKEELKIFNESMKACLYPDLHFGKNESIIKNYNSFIIESNQEAKDIEVTPVSKKIEDWYNKNMDLKAWILEKSEVEKIKSNLDKKLSDEKDSITIDGIDPILDIVRVFNRAYKIHTTKVIRTGRTGGQVSNKTFMEYTSFGGGSPDNAGASGGPYRNNKVFNIWEDEVLKILRNKDYQPIFNLKTKLKVGNEYIDKAGANLGKFMRDMIDGDDLYKSGSDRSGTQAKFLEKYFGYKDGNDASKTHFGGSLEKEENSSNADIIPNKVNVRFVKEGVRYNEIKDLVGTFFAVQKPNKAVQYFYIREIEGDYAYVNFCNSFGIFKDCLENGNNETPASVKDISTNGLKVELDTIKDNMEFIMKATRIKISSLINKEGKVNKGEFKISFLQKDGKDPNKSITKESVLRKEGDTFNIDQIWILVIPTDDEKIKRYTIKSKRVPYFTNIKQYREQNGNIEKCEMRKI